MLNVYEELKNFSAIDIEALERKGSVTGDEKSSYELYNKAIENLRQGNEDIAIIELKKAISLNSNFNEAANLLGLSYYIAQEYSLAAKVFQAVIDIEKNGIIAQSYLDNIMNFQNSYARKSSTRNRKMLNIIARRFKKALSKLCSMTKECFMTAKNNKMATGLIAGILIIVVTGFAIGNFIASRSNLTVNSNNEQGDNNTTLGDDLLSDEHGSYDEAQELDNTGPEINIKNVMEEVEGLYSIGKFEQAADNLILLRAEYGDDAIRGAYSQLVSKVFDVAGENLFVEGFQLYSVGKFNESIEKFKKVYIYDAPTKILDNMYYLLGKAYRETGNYIEAIDIFNRIIVLFPDSQYAVWARMRLDEMLTVQP